MVDMIDVDSVLDPMLPVLNPKVENPGIAMKQPWVDRGSWFGDFC